MRYGPMKLISDDMGLIQFVIAICDISLIHTQSVKCNISTVLVLMFGLQILLWGLLEILILIEWLNT